MVCMKDDVCLHFLKTICSLTGGGGQQNKKNKRGGFGVDLKKVTFSWGGYVHNRKFRLANPISLDLKVIRGWRKELAAQLEVNKKAIVKAFCNVRRGGRVIGTSFMVKQGEFCKHFWVAANELRGFFGMSGRWVKGCFIIKSLKGGMVWGNRGLRIVNRESAKVMEIVSKDWKQTNDAVVNFFAFDKELSTSLPENLLRVLFLTTTRRGLTCLLLNLTEKGGEANSSLMYKHVVSKIWLSGLGPRTLFVLGFVLRSGVLELNLEKYFKPNLGVCSLCNIGATVVGANWFPTMTLGYKSGGRLWRLFGGGRVIKK